MTTKMDIQTMIQTLQKFWGDKGCMLMQAYDVEKGAGTMSPYTFFAGNRTGALECCLR